MKCVKLNCNECGKEFDKSLSLYNVAIKNKQKLFYCSILCANKTKLHQETAKRVAVSCETCNKKFTKRQKVYNEAIKRGQTKFYCCNTCLFASYSKTRPIEYIELKCGNCEIKFLRQKSTYLAKIKSGRKNFYCSKSCATQDNLTKPNRKPSISGRDSLSPFRWFVLKVRARRIKKEITITAAYLKDLWESQDGKCPFSGWSLRLPHNSNTWDGDNSYKIDNASLDRIDNSKGYIEGNVRFVAVMANFARNSFTDEEVLKFCKAVAEHNKSK